MANFDPIWSVTDVEEAGYQNNPADNGNYCPAKGKPGSVDIGTNHGISAIGWAEYHGGVCPSVDQIKNLSLADAKIIAKKQYWDPIQGDKINSQAVAHLIFDFTYGGSGGPLVVRRAINQIKGAGTVHEFASFTLSDNEIAIINSIPEKLMFDTLTTQRQNFLVGNTFESQLLTRLNKLKALYVNTLQNAVVTVHKHLVPLVLIGIVFSVGIFLIIKQ